MEELKITYSSYTPEEMPKDFNQNLLTFDVLNYYRRKFKHHPHTIDNANLVDLKDLMTLVKEKFSTIEVVYTYSKEDFVKSQVLLLDGKIVLSIGDICKSKTKSFIYTDNSMYDNFKFENEDEKKVAFDIVTSFHILYDPANIEIVKSFILDYKKFSIKVEESKKFINVIARDGEGLYIKTFDIDDTEKFKIEDLDLYYGDGFEEFHNNLLERMSKSKKGITLFYGDPGTGKSFYIRNLILALNAAGKDIIYVPPSFISLITEPDFISFLTDYIMEKKKELVIVIEDAESVLVETNTHFRSNEVSNLLNISDGLLNDIMGIQFIFSMNSTLESVPDALKRPERMMARKSFYKLPKEKAIEIAAKLNLEIEITGDMSLAEIYAYHNKNNILVHEPTIKRKTKIGFTQG